ncbi:hypothetical protein M0D69_29445 [Caballeronia sp. SEWSISQ10-4 2]|uniref:hypothetical protein n=1 Tax=Caballeronia sp. SEWSISQ10-4 2 TaxID=2937438 RepID=UPI00265025D4|nr:hypothetical protein [Caballeronia sp. SEWSISQ10-4 2]MDN7182065.1 hypothetical protein [Caballeronia sp. SEWSISQ10-4 2]
MTTCYVQGAESGRAAPTPTHTRAVRKTAPAQGPEAAKVRKVVRSFFSRGATTQGHSRESEQVLAVALELAQLGEHLAAESEAEEMVSYNHVHVKPAFSVTATFKHIGKIKPRTFLLDE